ncbi:hypothetical protein [Novosphingobium aquimarinum]|uniref:hypothetical protein n=1 Tax=Novosphingobium aquimarinum TaxID=2682494 RepID=UPI0012EC8D5F|nr:hypothetical protein [Novosphingobium aquimarinum]
MADKGLARALRWASLILVLANVLAVVTVFLSGYDWDLDHEFYFGSRLLAGELLWTREFHDKLPMLQMVMVLPASFEAGIQVWRAMSLITCLVCFLGLRVWIPRLVGGEPALRADRQRVVDFGLLFLLFMTTMSPGGVSTINPVASFLAATVMVLMLLMAHSEPASTMARIAVFVLGGLAAALAISMRPYFLAPLAFTVLWLLAEAFLAKAPAAPRRKVLLQSIAWAASIGGFGVACNVLPYVVTGQVDALRDGLRLLASDVNQAPFLINVIGFLWVSLRDGQLLPVYIAAIFAGVTVLSLVGARKGEGINPLVYHAIGAIVVLFAFMAAKHWWNHYVHLFDAFAGYLLILFLIQICEGRLRDAIGAPLRAASRYALPLLALLCLGLAVRDLVHGTRAADEDHPHAVLVREITRYRASRPASDRSILVPVSVYAHWQLNEGRHGFPHAANTGHILAGWWQQIGPFTGFLAPRDAREYCRTLMRRGPAIVVTFQGMDHPRPNRELARCLSAPGSRYRLDTVRKLSEDAEIDFFIRR